MGDGSCGRGPWGVAPTTRSRSRRGRSFLMGGLALQALAAVVLGLGGPSIVASGLPGSLMHFEEGVQAQSAQPSSGRTCEPIRVELCRSAVRGYNMTTMPNLVGHEFQREAAGHLSTFAPLVQYGCSKQLLVFLCAVLVPMCTDQVDAVHAEGAALAEAADATDAGEQHAEAGVGVGGLVAGLSEVRVVAIGPCRGLCEAVRARCLPVLLNFSYPWPPQLDCARFPPHNSPAHMCMEGPGEEDGDEDAAHPGLPASAPAPASLPTGHHGHGAGGTRCAEPLPHFSRADKQMAEVWLSVWSGLCFVSSVLALLTLRLGPGPGPGPAAHHAGPPAAAGRLGSGARTRVAATVAVGSPPVQGQGHRQRQGTGPSPLTSLALSYGLLSVGWGIRVLAGRAAPTGPGLALAAPLASPWASLASPAASAVGAAVVVDCEAADLRNPNCAAVFLLTYYFGTASIIWWVVLTVVWFLSAGLRVSPAALQRHSYPFHLAGWGVPAGLTLGALVLRDVAADPLTGACQVGPTWFTVFVLAPQSACLCMGLLFLALGALTQWRSKPTGSGSGTPPWPPAAWPSSSPGPAMWPLAVERLGLLAGVCAAPLAVLVATHALELGHAGHSLASSAAASSVSLRLFQARLVASLVVGVAAPFWVWPGERPWPPCPPWPRPPRAWRYPAASKLGATAAPPVGRQGSRGSVALSASTTAPASAPLLGGARAGAGTKGTKGAGSGRPTGSALLGPPLPAPGPAALGPVIAVPGPGPGPARPRGGSGSSGKHRALSAGRHHHKHHGSETTV